MLAVDIPSCPPLDGSLEVLPGFLDFHVQHNPEHPYFVFPNPDPDSFEYGKISFQQFADATHRVAHALRPGRAGPERAVAAILINCDTLLYHALTVGLIRAGIVPCPMYTSNTPTAISNMLEHTGCHRIIYQSAFAPLIDSVRSHLPAEYALTTDLVPTLTKIFPEFSSSLAPIGPIPYPASSQMSKPSDVVLYLHSSGSTGLPKSIPHTHTTILHWCSSSVLTEGRNRGIRWGSMAAGAFLTMGICMQLYAPLVSGQPASLFPPQEHLSLPPMMPTPQNTLDAARRTRANALPTAPLFLEIWAQNEEDVKFLASLQGVKFAGGPLSPVNGAKLAAAGVRLYAVYASTELGPITAAFYTEEDSVGLNSSNSSSDVEKTRLDWAWLNFSTQCSPRWIPQGNGTYELHIMSCSTHQPSVENLPGNERGYATSDLFEPHPTKSGLWRIVGRTDDVIVLSTALNVVPIPQEGHIGAHPFVAGAVMFGRGHIRPGVLIEPRPEHAVAPGDGRARVFLDAIWSQIVEANKLVPPFATILKEMVLIADSARPFQRAAKGTIQRKPTLALYQADIDALYESIGDTRSKF